jgi:hypothetical protein
MRIAKATLSSISPYSQNKAITETRGKRESHDEFERRCWKERVHYDDQGMAYIPPMSFKNMIAESAKFTPRIGPSGGKSTWTKNFEAGILVLDPVPLGVHRDDVQGEWLHLPANGKRGPGPRVWKYMPVFSSWHGTVIFHLVDDAITAEIFQTYLIEAGTFIGIGRFRPRNNGFYGRFRVDGLDVSQVG